MKQVIFLILALSCFVNLYAQAPDPTFRAGLFKAGTVNALLPIGEDQFIAGGDFVRVNYQWTGPLVRMNKDGSLDPTFQIQKKLNGRVNEVLPARDQTRRLLIRGFGLHYDGDPISPVAVLDADGAVLNSFVFPKEDVLRISKLLVTADNQILVAGVDLDNEAFLLRMDWEGKLDSDFSFAPFPGEIKTMIELSDGKLLIGNNPTFVDLFSMSKLARLESDGSLDSTFSITFGELGTARSIDFLHYVSDSCIYFTSNLNRRLFKINRDGDYRQDFIPFPYQYWPILADDQEILLGGFSSTSFFERNGSFIENQILRIGEDKQLDTLTVGSGFQGVTRTGLTLKDGSILIGGSFLRFNETIAPGLVMLQAETFEPDLAFQPVFQSPGLVSDVVELQNGSLIVGGAFDYVDTTLQSNLAKLKPNGEHDALFSLEAHPNFPINTLNLLSDESIVTTGIYWVDNDDLSAINGFAIFTEDGTIMVDSIDLQGLDISISTTISYVFGVDLKDQIYINAFFRTSDNRSGSFLRLNNLGQIDTLFFNDFSRPDRFPFISDVLVQSDGKVIFSGSNMTYKGFSTLGLLRIDGEDNVDFDTFRNTSISNNGGGLVLSNDKLYVYEIDNSVGLGIDFFKLLPDGGTDLNFEVLKIGPSLHSSTLGLSNMILLPDDRFFLNGNFRTINGEEVIPPLIFDSTGIVDPAYKLPYIGNLGNALLTNKDYFFAYGQLTSSAYPASVGILKYQNKATTAVREREYLLNRIRIVPNPVMDYLTINFAEDIAKFPKAYQIYDSAGRQLASGLITEQFQKISVETLIPGNYQILILDKERSAIGRFIKM